jgi:hypothetical protein
MDVYLGTRAVAVCCGAEVLLTEHVEDFDGAVGRLQAWLQTQPKCPSLRLWLSGGLCRPFIVPAVTGLASTAERLKVAEAMALQKTGLTGDCQVWLERADKAGIAIAVAIERVRLAQITRVTSKIERKPDILSIRPWWSEALRHVLGREPGAVALGVQDCDSMTVLAGQIGAYEMASTYSPVFDEPTAQSVLMRALMPFEGLDGNEIVARLVFGKMLDAGALRVLALCGMAEFSR